MAGYGTLEPTTGWRREATSSRQGSASILTTIVAGSLVFTAVLLLATSETFNNPNGVPVELSDLDDAIPAAVDELQHHVNLDEKKSW